MNAKLIIIVLIAILIALQYKLWFEDGGVRKVAQLQQQLAHSQAHNQKLLARNQTLRAEIEDLQSGHRMLEGVARRELGMIKDGETYYQMLGQPKDESKP